MDLMVLLVVVMEGGLLGVLLLTTGDWLILLLSTSTEIGLHRVRVVSAMSCRTDA